MADSAMGLWMRQNTLPGVLSQSKAGTRLSTSTSSPPQSGTQRLPSTYEHAGGPVGQGSVGEVGMARYPPDVSRAPVHILRLVIEDVLEGGGSIKHVPAHGVQHALRGEGTALSASSRALVLLG